MVIDLNLTISPIRLLYLLLQNLKLSQNLTKQRLVTCYVINFLFDNVIKWSFFKAYYTIPKN